MCVHRSCVPASQAEFWKELASLQPSLSKLDSLGWEYDEATRKADVAFTLMLTLNPRAVSVIRRYAQYLVEVLPLRRFS